MFDPESALLGGVLDVLRLDGPYPDSECSVQYDGLPVPTMGQRYLAVAPASWESAKLEQSRIGYVIGVEVHVWTRMPVAPSDADGALLTDPGQLNAVCDDVARLLHLNYDVLTRANALLTGEPSSSNQWRFVEPLYFRGIGRPTASWDVMFGQPKGDRGGPLAMGRTVRFDGARC